MKKVLLVCSTYYSDISASLRKQASLALDSSKIKHDYIEVPGIFEIPVIISKNIKKYDGFLALGCVIKGETPHFEFISKVTFEAIMKLSINNKKPIGNGIITALNLDQAVERQGPNDDGKEIKKGKGLEAANAVISVLTNVKKR